MFVRTEIDLNSFTQQDREEEIKILRLEKHFDRKSYLKRRDSKCEACCQKPN